MKPFLFSLLSGVMCRWRRRWEFTRHWHPRQRHSKKRKVTPMTWERCVIHEVVGELQFRLGELIVREPALLFRTLAIIIDVKQKILVVGSPILLFSTHCSMILSSPFNVFPPPSLSTVTQLKTFKLLLSLISEKIRRSRTIPSRGKCIWHFSQHYPLRRTFDKKNGQIYETCKC